MKSFIRDIIYAILEFEARFVLTKYNPKIIAVTGSVGKTSTKDAIFTVLSGSSFIRKSEKSFNGEVGIPLTILGCDNGWNNPILWLKNIFQGLELIFFREKYPDCLILEVGVDRPGDIKRIIEWLKTDISVVTKISDVPVHVEFFRSIDELVKEKAYLAKALKDNGTLILSGDDEKVKNIGRGMSQKIITFGTSIGSMVTASHDSIIYENGNPIGMNFKLNYEGNSLPVTIRGIMGSHHMYPLMAAAAVGIASKISLIDIVDNLGKYIPPKGRMNILRGLNESTIIDDTYNSSPDALNEALKTLEKIETTGRKIAIIGDMMELGKFSAEEHRKAGENAGRVASIIISIGQRARLMPNVTKSFDTSLEALDFVKSVVKKGDVILVKGSQSVRMERITEALLADPSLARSVLVRQDSEWLAKK